MTTEFLDSVVVEKPEWWKEIASHVNGLPPEQIIKQFGVNLPRSTFEREITDQAIILDKVLSRLGSGITPKQLNYAAVPRVVSRNAQLWKSTPLVVNRSTRFEEQRSEIYICYSYYPSESTGMTDNSDQRSPPVNYGAVDVQKLKEFMKLTEDDSVNIKALDDLGAITVKKPILHPLNAKKIAQRVNTEINLQDTGQAAKAIKIAVTAETKKVVPLAKPFLLKKAAKASAIVPKKIMQVKQSQA